MIGPNTQRGLLNTLTKKKLFALSKKHQIPQKASQTKTGLISVIMGHLTKAEIANEVNTIK